MTAGLQVYSDSGLIQIDDRYSNLALRTKFTTTTSSVSGTLDTLNYATVDVSATYPIVAVNTAGRIALLGAYSIGTNLWRLQFVSSSGNTTFTAYVFDYPVSPGNNFGLQVFRDDGVLAFDSNIKYAKVAAIVNRPAGQPSQVNNAGAAWTYSGLPTSTYAAIMPSRQGVNQLNGTYIWQICDCLTTNANGIAVSLMPFIGKMDSSVTGSGTWIDTSLSSTIAILDVTGL